MELPGNVSQSALLERIKLIHSDALNNRSTVPDMVMGYIEDCIVSLDTSKPDTDKLYKAADNILISYYDKGSKEIPTHVELFNLAIGIVKMFDTQRSLVRVRQLLTYEDAPKTLHKIADLLESMITAFGVDGRMDKRRYDDFAPRLRALAGANRFYLESNVDRAIFTI